MRAPPLTLVVRDDNPIDRAEHHLVKPVDPGWVAQLLESSPQA